MSLRYYKSSVSQFFFIIFAMYLGYYMGFVYDLMRHYMEIPMYYTGRDLNTIFGDFRVYLIGKEPFHILFKYVFSRFTDSRQMFGAISSGMYAMSFVFFLRQFKEFYNRRLPAFSTVLLLCVATVIEFYWYQGLRFWLGVYVFMGFYLKYVNSGKWWWLLFTPLVLLIHYALVTLIIAALLNILLHHVTVYSRIAFLAFAFVIRSLNIDFVPLLLKYLPFINDLGISISDEKIRTSVLEHMNEVRTGGNIFYQNRTAVLLICGILILTFFRYCRLRFNDKHITLLYFALTLFSIACIGYVDLTFYERFSKVCVLVLYCYLFIVSVQNVRQWSRYHIMLFLVALSISTFSVFVVLMQIRSYLFYNELIFGNIFIDWDGNALNMKYGWN
ncbi:MAG: hypothetical protein HUK11_00175 [Muribaculaceae bacterium]|nr:hypothetical protein [Muribaculaceae bacterium]